MRSKHFWNSSLIVFTILLLMTGTIMKLAKLPGGGLLLLGGILFFMFSTVLYFFRRHQSVDHYRDKRMTIPLLISIILLILGKAFVVMHFPGGGMMQILGCLGLLVFYLIRYTAKKSRGFLDHVKLGIVLLFALQGGRYIQGGFILYIEEDIEVIKWMVRAIHWTLIAIWFVMQGFTYFSKDPDPEVNYFSNAIFTMALLFILAGAYCRFTGIEYGFHLIIIGLVCGLFWTFYERIFERSEEGKERE